MYLSKKRFKDFLISTLITLILIYVFDLTSSLPIPIFHQSITTTIILLEVIFLSFYGISAIRNRKVNKIFMLLIPVALIPILSSINASQYFNQPILYGFLAERTKINFTIGIILIVILEKNYITINLLEKILYKFSIIYFSISLFFYFAIDPNLFKDSLFVIYSTSKGYIYKFNLILPAFLFFYSFCQLIFSKKVKLISIIIIILTLGYLIFLAKARALSVMIILCSFVFGFLNSSNRKKIFIYTIGATFFIVFLLVAYIFVPNDINEINKLFISAFNVFIGGEVSDLSAASRITQFEIGKTEFLTSPIFGNGTLSSQWQNGYLGRYNHFNPSDIGWLGILYVYGIFGFLILKLPFIHSATFKFNPLYKENIFFNANKLLFLLLFLHGIFAAYEFKKFGMIVFVYSILYYYKYKGTET